MLHAPPYQHALCKLWSFPVERAWRWQWETKSISHTKQLVIQVQDALNSRFKNMRDAFRKMDLDNSGKLDEDELMRALNMWNLPIDRDELRAMIHNQMDFNHDGAINYEEFVDALARDTVNPAAMGTRGKTALEAFGVPDLDPRYLGHVRIKNFRMDEDEDVPEDTVPVNAKGQREIVQQVEHAVNSHFKSMHAAFKFMDVDNSGSVNKDEIKRAAKLWNIRLPESKLHALMDSCDVDGSGSINYEEFVATLAGI